MNKLLEYRIRRQIEQYKKKPSLKLRESIFKKTDEHIMSVLKMSLRMHRRYRSDEEVLSMAWDVFEESLRVYVQGMGVRKLLSTRAILHVKRMVSGERRENKRTCSLELVGEESLGDDIHRAITIPMMDLQELRKSLSPEYQLIFDDAIKSFGGNNRDKMKDPRCPIPSGRYYESKNVFQMIVSYFLRSN
jgi:hypothetical protein